MRTVGLVALPVFVLAIIASATAQERPVTTKKESADTLKVSVSGSTVLDYVWRSREITQFRDSVASNGSVDAAAENTFEGFVGVRMDIEMSDKVSAVVEFGTKRVDGGTDPWGSATAEVVKLREANVVVADWLTQALKLQIGLSTWSFDVRGRGNSFAFDPRHSASFGKNTDTTADDESSLGSRAGSPDEMDPVGAVLTYVRDLLTVEAVILPAVLEGGPVSGDESLFAVDLWYALDTLGKGSRLGAIVAATHIATDTGGGNLTHGTVYTIGGGADIKGLPGMDGLELYGEGYFQFGTIGNVGGTDIDAGGYALQVGGQYSLPSAPGGIWVGLNFTLITGDSDTSATDDKCDSFLSYENINDLLILEDMYFGFDWDTNYMAVKLSAGGAMSVSSGKDNLLLSATLGFAKTAEDVLFPDGKKEDSLGTEVDFRAKWIITKQASLNAGVGLLFGSDVLEQSMKQGTGDSDGEDSAMLYTVGADLRF